MMAPNEMQPAIRAHDKTHVNEGERLRLMMDVTGLCAMWAGDVMERRGDEELKILMLKGMHDVRHRPVLTFNMRHFESLAGVCEGERKIEVIQLPDGEQIGSWELKGRVVRINPLRLAEPEGVRLLGQTEPPSESPSNPTDEYGLHWIPSVGRACRQSKAKVHSRYLGDHPGKQTNGNGDKVDDTVLARVDLPQGFIYSSARINDLRDPDIWEFTDGKSVVMRQFIAETARCEIRNLPSHHVEIAAFPYGRPQDRETLHLKTWDDSIRLTLTNLPAVDVLIPDEFRHFMAYYDLLDPVPEKEAQSKPRKVEGRRGPLGPLVDDPMLKPPSEPPDEVMTARGVRPVMCSPACIP